MARPKACVKYYGDNREIQVWQTWSDEIARIHINWPNGWHKSPAEAARFSEILSEAAAFARRASEKGISREEFDQVYE